MTGLSLLPWRAARPEQARADIAELTGLLGSGDLRATTTTLPPTGAARAHQLLEDRAVLGRIVLTP